MAQSNESGSQSSEDNSDNRRRRGPRRNFFGDSLGGGGSGFFSGITTIKIPGSNNDIDLKILVGESGIELLETEPLKKEMLTL